MILDCEITGCDVTVTFYSLLRAQKTLRNETIAVIGYGYTGSTIALNLRDNGFNVIVGQRKNSNSWHNAIKDGWEENVDLFLISDACSNSSIIMNLLSDQGKITEEKIIKRDLHFGKTICFFNSKYINTNEPMIKSLPRNIDIIFLEPQSKSCIARHLFVEEIGIHSDFAVLQNSSGFADSIAISLGIGMGAAKLNKTSYENISIQINKPYGEIATIMETQYRMHKKNANSTCDAIALAYNFIKNEITNN